MNPEATGKMLLLIGGVIAAAGALLIAFGRLGLGKLPGDIHIQREGWTLNLPLVTCLLISIVLTVVLNLLRR